MLAMLRAILRALLRAMLREQRTVRRHSASTATPGAGEGLRGRMPMLASPPHTQQGSGNPPPPPSTQPPRCVLCWPDFKEERWLEFAHGRLIEPPSLQRTLLLVVSRLQPSACTHGFMQPVSWLVRWILLLASQSEHSHTRCIARSLCKCLLIVLQSHEESDGAAPPTQKKKRKRKHNRSECSAFP